ncbi:MAG: hypothetical protein R3233_10510 [Xanthomonadales bacterium]|nr:hypothetical protein [Xanthomonadales bacterium]
MSPSTGAASPPESGPPPAWQAGGHLKLQFNGRSFPGDSVFRDVLGRSARELDLEARLKLAMASGPWDFQADAQFLVLHGDELELADALPGSALPLKRVIGDDRRWWNLTHSFGDGRTAFVQRLDRLNVGYTTARSSWRFGRQAISWGNGLLFNPADVFNPFDPAAVDTEYKTGDDMLYGQYLFGDGSDLQGVAVVRRDPGTGATEADQSSLAFKYHGFLGTNEYDFLAARHYGDGLLGVGGSVGIGGAVLRGDLTWTDADREEVISAVASLGYSWTWGGHNVNGVLEYYHNGFGQHAGDYALADLARNPDLLSRLERGELYTLGRDYLGASATIEATPLLLVTPNLFVNLQDPSALAQLVVQWDLAQEALLLCAVNLPLGPGGSEYGGIEAPMDGRYFSTGLSLFAQLAWYF